MHHASESFSVLSLLVTRPLVSTSESPLFCIHENTLGLTSSFSRWVLDLLNAFCECYTTRRNSLWASLTSSFWLSLSVFMRVIQRVGCDTDSLTAFNGHSSHRPEQRVDDWGAISQIVVVTLILLVINVCLEIMLLSILETKVDLQLWSDASLSVQRAKSAGSNRRDLPWISDQRVRGWALPLHDNELFHELLGIWGPMSLNRHW